jgi:hypothetical protein
MITVVFAAHSFAQCTFVCETGAWIEGYNNIADLGQQVLLMGSGFPDRDGNQSADPAEPPDIFKGAYRVDYMVNCGAYNTTHYRTGKSVTKVAAARTETAVWVVSKFLCTLDTDARLLAGDDRSWTTVSIFWW